MSGNLANQLLRNIGVKTTGPPCSRLPSIRETRSNEKWLRVIRMNHPTVAALLSASLVVYLFPGMVNGELYSSALMLMLWL